MSSALRAAVDPPPFLPVNTTPVSDIAAQLRETGLVALEHLVMRSAALAFAASIMTVTTHRDSDPDGLTRIYDTRRHAEQPGFAGLSNGELAPHTERSGLPRPPRLMLLVCASAPALGGECLLTDGQAVHQDLATHHPEALDLLSAPNTAYFGDGAGHATQVFTRYPSRRVAIRLRLDALARWSPLVEPHLPHLRSAIQRHQIVLPLRFGQAYLLDNTRWLHGRTAFSGDRLMWRALGEPLPILGPLAFGFRQTLRAAERKSEVMW
ncbi:TauD/TfdA family dioxygenase [Streptomyces xanthochromogenes]|uniref:TauD/TfdA family dioxygenase n=1 Tax=Streptomyces xanthochromogenes TaxID=67384 RepID=UPI0037B4D522